MTPDMKRLCEAAEQAIRNDDPLRSSPAETIVRAVLIKLQQTSESMRETGAAAVADHFPPGQAPERAEGIARDVIVGVIDHILAEPT